MLTCSTEPKESVSSLKANCFLRFEIPWEKLPTDLLYKLEKQERPYPKQRQAMMRIIINEVTSVCKRPSKKYLTEIARKMVLKYHKSLQDVIEGQIVGSRYDSLVKQLQARAENVKRTISFTKRQLQQSGGSDTEEIPSKKQASPQDTYGCITWDPAQLPKTETVTSKIKQQEEMKTIFTERNWIHRLLPKKMMTTFYTQRKDIIRGMATEKLKKEWPFLFEMSEIQAHFRELTGVQLDGTYSESLKSKGQGILAYKKTKSTKKSRTICRNLDTQRTT